jgi:hypothetical protein
VLLVNIAAGNSQQIAALFGPVHGAAWLTGVLATWRDPRRDTRAAVCAVVPGVGGLLALRALDRADSQAESGGLSRVRPRWSFRHGRTGYPSPARVARR